MTLLLDTHAFLWFCQDDQVYPPAPFAAVDRQSDFGIGRSVVGRFPENDEIGRQLPDQEDLAVDVQVHANVG